MHNFYIDSNGKKKDPYSDFETRASPLSAAIPVAEQSLGNKRFKVSDFDFDYIAKEERENQPDIIFTKDDDITHCNTKTACQLRCYSFGHPYLVGQMVLERIPRAWLFGCGSHCNQFCNHSYQHNVLIIIVLHKNV